MDVLDAGNSKCGDLSDLVEGGRRLKGSDQANAPVSDGHPLSGPLLGLDPWSCTSTGHIFLSFLTLAVWELLLASPVMVVWDLLLLSRNALLSC